MRTGSGRRCSVISRFHRGEGGEVLLLLSDEERTLLRAIAGGTLALLAGGDDQPELRRLFPPAYDDPKLDEEYRELTRPQLVTGRERALELLAATVDDDV